MERRASRSRNDRIRTWYVTGPPGASPGAVSRHGGVPCGTGHARRLGSSRTACGLPVLSWRIFWLVQLADLEDACADCRQVVALEPTG